MYDLDHVAHFLLNLITETYADMVTWRCYFRNNDFLHGLCLNFIIYIYTSEMSVKKQQKMNDPLVLLSMLQV